MFIAKFNQTTGSPFTSDKNGHFPFIGTVLAGKSTGTLINGTMFLRDGLMPNKAYLCDNIIEEYEGKPQVRVQIIGEVPMLEFVALRTQLGAPVTAIGSSNNAVDVISDEPVLAEDAKGKK